MLKKMLKKYNDLPKEVKASLWFLICSFLQKGISVISTPIFTRLLTTSEYGQYNVFNSWLGIITVFVTLSLFNGVYTQGLVKFSDEKHVYSSSLQGMTLTMIIAWLVVYVLTHSFWNQIFSLTTVQMLLMFSLMWTSAVYSFWAAEQRVEVKYKQLVIVSLLVSFSKPLVGIILVKLANDKVLARIIGLVCVEILGYTWMFFAQIKKGKVFYSPKFWKYAFLFSIPLIPHYLAQNILAHSDRIMIERMVGSSEAGIYSLAYSIAQIMVLFNTALIQTISPWMFKKIKARQEMQISSIAYTSLVFIAAVNVLLIALAPEMVRFFAPAEYYEAIWVVPPVAMSVFFMFCYSIFVNFEFYFEKTSFITIATLLSATLNLLLNYIFIQVYGYMAAGYTTLFCYIIQVVGHFVFMKKICNTKLDGSNVFNIRILLPLTASFLLFGFLFMFTYKYIYFRYILLGTGVVVCFFLRHKIIAYLSSILAIRRNK